MDRPKRAFILGLDGASADLVLFLMKNNVMPNLLRLKRKGVFIKALSSLPTHTPTNWTTISTGALPGTHGITGFSILTKGKSYLERKSGFDTRMVRAEFLWQAAERAGKKCILLKWAGPQFPVTLKHGIQIDGCFCVSCIHEISGPKLYSSIRNDQHVVRINVRNANEWRNIPSHFINPLETELILGDDLKCKIYLLITGSKGKGYDRVAISKNKDFNDVIGFISPGEWSKWFKFIFKSGEKCIEGTVRLKLVWLSSDGNQIEIYCSQIMPVKGWSYPTGVDEELVENIGPFLQRVGYIQEGEIYGAWVDYETFIEELEYQHRWFIEASKYLSKKYEWDLFFLHSHAPDYILDSVIRRAEPLTASKDTDNRYYMELIKRTFRIVDNMVGEIYDEIIDGETLLAIVSDHGVIGYHGDRSITQIIRDILIKKKLLVYKKKTSVGVATKPQKRGGEIDWSKTKAIVHDDIYIYINLKGREPHGIVDPTDYEKVRDEIIESLLEYRDPILGRSPFTLILRAEDAEILGLYGDRIGDIIFTVREGGKYSEGHGIYLPTARYGMSSIYAFILLAGPGIRENYEFKRPVHLIDLAPTISFLLGFPPPQDSQGSILFEAFNEEIINFYFKTR